MVMYRKVQKRKYSRLMVKSLKVATSVGELIDVLRPIDSLFDGCLLFVLE